MSSEHDSYTYICNYSVDCRSFATQLGVHRDSADTKHVSSQPRCIRGKWTLRSRQSPLQTIKPASVFLRSRYVTRSV